ncbi:MAG: Uma2 family endonuclease [Anaerolineae bacterium]
MTTPAPARLMTGAELLRLPAYKRYELVRGELVPMSPTSGAHGIAQIRFGGILSEFVEAHQLGYVMSEVGFYLAHDPDTVRGPDVAFVRTERASESDLERGFIEGAPDLAVEITSPGDTMDEMMAKVQEYLAAGAAMVCVITPRTRSMTVYRPNGSAAVLTAAGGDTFHGEGLLSGFSLPVARLFIP